MINLYLSGILGIGMLISGIFVLRHGLKKVFFQSFKKVIKALTKTSWHSLFTGIAGAALMQSSTAVSLITIGLVSADYLSFQQGLGIILGANIGTCSTVQLLSIPFPENLYLPFLLISTLGFIFIKALRYPFLALTGLISMFTGLMLLSKTCSEIVAFPAVFECVSKAQGNPFYGIMAGVLLTLLFQSSSAATAIAMVLAADGIIDLITAAYIVYGNNIGSCLSSLVISAAAPLGARRIALSHFLLNVLGVLVFLPLTNLLIQITQWIAKDFSWQIALFHTFFNLLSSMAVFPLLKQYAKLIMLLIPNK